MINCHNPNYPNHGHYHHYFYFQYLDVCSLNMFCIIMMCQVLSSPLLSTGLLLTFFNTQIININMIFTLIVILIKHCGCLSPFWKANRWPRKPPWCRRTVDHQSISTTFLSCSLQQKRELLRFDRHELPVAARLLRIVLRIVLLLVSLLDHAKL